MESLKHGIVEQMQNTVLCLTNISILICVERLLEEHNTKYFSFLLGKCSGYCLFQEVPCCSKLTMTQEGVGYNVKIEQANQYHPFCFENGSEDLLFFCFAFGLHSSAILTLH